MKQIYFDYAASTSVDKQVLAAMQPYFCKEFGNPSALHIFGQRTSAAIYKAREIIAKSVGVDYKNIIFTGSATEANNLALRGVIAGLGGKFNWRPRIIISAIEHESVLETAKDLEKAGIEVIYLPVDKNGIVKAEKLRSALNNRTVLVSIMYANNEVGSIQPIKKISKIVQDFKNQKSEIKHRVSSVSPQYPLLHSDAVQAFQYLKCDINELGVDMITLSSHKIYGPKGIGALCVRHGVKDLLRPIITGGGQEFGMRSGTENVAFIVGLGEAVRITEEKRESEFARIKKLTTYFLDVLKRNIPRLAINGSMKDRLPNNLSIYFHGRNAQELLVALDLNGISISTGSACYARTCRPSYVLAAMGFPIERASSSLRFSFGRHTTKEEIDISLKRIIKLITLKAD